MVFAGILTLSIAVGVTFPRRQPGQASWSARLLCLLARAILALRYRVHVEGAAIVKQRGTRRILFLPNHPALIDPVIVLAHIYGKFAVRPVALADRIKEPAVSALADLLGVLRVPVLSEPDQSSVKELQWSIDLCVEALKRGENVLLYPAGRLMRHRFENLGGVSAAHRIISEVPDIRVVLVRTKGLWGSSFGWASGRPPRLKNGLFGHIRQLLVSGLLFAPKRAVQVELAEPDDLPRHADRLGLNAYLDDFYNHGAPPALYVPYSICERSGTRELTEPTPTTAPSVNDAPAATRQIVLAHLHKLTGIDGLHDAQELARDLGLDSLAITEALLWLEREFAVSVAGVESVRTVGDMIMAACGGALAESTDVQIPAPSAGGWQIQAARASKFLAAPVSSTYFSRRPAATRAESLPQTSSKEVARTAI